ncbi:MAG: GTP-binding protein [Halomonas sp.]|nr:GTP-binding protein [Halomonas sp.]
MTPSDAVRAPLTVIGGFLGAGKTTYLNALIREGIPEHSLIVINDFGDINIDAELIDYRDEQLIQLTNGCICCTLGGTLAEQLAKAMRLKASPEAVFIETSGVADPARIADIARLSHRLTLKEVVCLVDGAQIDTHRHDPLTGDTWRAQLQAATRILVNRLSAADDVDARLSELRQLNATAVIHDMGGRAGSAADERSIESPAITARALYHDTASQSGWQSASLTMPGAVDIDRLRDLLLDYGDVLLRAKGFLYCRARQQRRLLQFSGGRLNSQPAPARSGRCQLVCIGRAGGRFEALIAALSRLGQAEAAGVA